MRAERVVPEVAAHPGALLGEAPTWDPVERRLLWVDIPQARIHTYDPASGARTVMVAEQRVGAAKPRKGGGLVVNLRDGVGLYGPDGRSFAWLHHDPRPWRRGNDAAVAPDGALWAGTITDADAPGAGTLTRVSGDGTAVTVLPEVSLSNGIGWSPDGRFMYFVDTETEGIDVFDVCGDGGGCGGVDVAGRRTLVRMAEGEGRPDGLTVDAEGCVWVALWNGGAVRRYTPEGTLDRELRLPVRRPTSCAFGGADLTDLYVTSARVGVEPAAEPLAGALLVLPGAGEGVAQSAFAG
ncbi:SMP-30/gluconolactonase/LRE family protein [Streptomyces sp. NPDC048172]|uniref:SMP-30/gluconolactonase/LRE family protein n=1 Tax=Streptomyces sp. NPDC048172 TaxID=3365505 RepID=UPI003717F8B2